MMGIDPKAGIAVSRNDASFDSSPQRLRSSDVFFFRLDFSARMVVQLPTSQRDSSQEGYSGDGDGLVRGAGTLSDERAVFGCIHLDSSDAFTIKKN